MLLPLSCFASTLDIPNLIAAVFGNDMVPVIRCESNFLQYNPNTGKPYISGTGDVGTMQINISTWGKIAQDMGLDIYNSTYDNIIMGEYIFRVSGIGAWSCDRIVYGKPAMET